VRHEHEWRVWQNAKLPPGKMLMPGVVSLGGRVHTDLAWAKLRIR